MKRFKSIGLLSFVIVIAITTIIFTKTAFGAPLPTDTPPGPTATPTDTPTPTPTPTDTPTPTPAPFTISGKVINTDNNNGYSGATLTITGGGSKQTDGSGNYSFSIPAGIYTVTLSPSANYQITPPNLQTVTVGPSQNNINFSVSPFYSITGNISDTVNGGKMSGVPVQLTAGPSAPQSTASNNNGDYTFSNLLAGTYTVTITIPNQHKCANNCTYTIIVGPGGSPPPPIGLFAVYALSGIVYLDTIANPFPGATINLSQNGSVVATTSSGPDGSYSFPNTTEGDYTIALQMPSGYSSTTANSLNITLNADYALNFGLTLSNITKVGGKCNNNTLDVMIIFDNSGSMNQPDPSTGNPKMNEARTAANSFVNIIGSNLPSARIGVVQMSGSRPNTPGNTWLDQSLTPNLSLVTTAINNITYSNPDGGTCFDCAIKLANDELTHSRPNAQKMVIFMTDGIANTDLANNGTYCDPGNTCNGVDWTVYNQNGENAAMNLAIAGVQQQNIIYTTIGIGSGGMPNIDQPFLQQLANTNYGTYYNDPSYNNLQSIFQSIAGNYASTGEIDGFVFNDKNDNATYDAGDLPLQNWTLQLTGDQLGGQTLTAQSDANGNYAFTALCTGNYTVTQQLSPPWLLTTPYASYNVDVVSGNSYANYNFGDRYGYSIDGVVFNDINKDRLKNNGEQNYTLGINVTTSGGDITVRPDGSYSIIGLLPGTYTVSYIPQLPKGYNMIWPLGAPPSFKVTVGTNPPCSLLDNSTGGRCDGNGNIVDLNFAVSNSIPWMQSYGLDLRLDNGFTDTIPNTPPNSPDPACGGPYALAPGASATNPGLIFSGDGSVDYGNGQASTTNWQVGGLQYPEVFSPPKTNALSSSYNSLLAAAAKANLTTKDMTQIPGCSDLANCSLPPDLASGIYTTTGRDVNLVGNFTAPDDHRYIFLIDGNLTLSGNIQVPVAAGSFILFSASKDLVIPSSVHAPTDTCPAPPGQLQGIFSADGNVTVESSFNCVTHTPDTMLNLEGTLIANAALRDGVFTNQRDLCGDNPLFPAFTIKARPDFFLNAPQFLMQVVTSSREEVP